VENKHLSITDPRPAFHTQIFWGK